MSSTTVREYSRLSAEQFVQTAVFVDDKIYGQPEESKTKKPTLVEPPVRSRKAALKSAAKTPRVASEPEPLPPEDASPQDILVSFAKKRVVCSLYEPRKNASVGCNSDAYQLCSSADIIIIDWDLYGDRGEKAKELVNNLIEHSLTDVPQQLRLVLIYTAELTLSKIASEIYDGLVKLKVEINPTKEDRGLAMHSPNTRVVVLGKPTVIARAPSFKDYEVSGDEIADRALDEFSKLASGLLQGAVLAGLGQIRRNSRRVLSKFDASLDAAFLTHRALLMPQEEANEHIWPLLVNEIQSILADCISDPDWSDELLKDWCEKRWAAGPSMRALETNAANHLALAQAFCLTGPAARGTFAALTTFTKNPDEKGYIWKVGNDNLGRIETLLLAGATDDSNRILAQIMSQRTHYASKSRTLKLGTILKSAAAGTKEFLICLQPVCDCVRLESATPFIFCSAEIADKKGNNIVLTDGKFVKLNFRPESKRCVMKLFAPSNSTNLVEAALVKDQYVFSTIDKEELHWVAELKPDHAQRAAEQFARELSRVGLTESEWMRLNSR